MLMSLPANPVPSELYHVIVGSPGLHWLPWYIWGAGTYATKYGYDTTKYIGYLGTISVPLIGDNVVVKSLRVQAAVSGKQGATEGAMIIVRLYENTGNLSSPLATVFVDYRTIPETSLGSVYVDITQSISFVASASSNELAIDLIGEGQGIATITGLAIDFGN
jgi:hypothetical protein